MNASIKEQKLKELLDDALITYVLIRVSPYDGESEEAHRERSRIYFNDRARPLHKMGKVVGGYDYLTDENYWKE
jgi:hypothetical protein